VEDLTTEELRERAALIAQIRSDLEAIKELDVLTEDDIEAAKDHLGTLHSLKDMDDWMPFEDDIDAAKDHLGTLHGIKEMSEWMPKEDDIEAAEEHLATLHGIKEHDEAA
jgi:hypothetical protein